MEVKSIILSLLFFPSIFASYDLLRSGSEAIDFASKNSGVYVAVIWPLGMDSSDYILNELNGNFNIKYRKTYVLNGNSLFLLYRYLHRSMSYKTAKRYFTPYLRNFNNYCNVTFILFQTGKSLEYVTEFKKNVRDGIGVGYRSFHINDFKKQSLEAARLVFNQRLMKKIKKFSKRKRLNKWVKSFY